MTQFIEVVVRARIAVQPDRHRGVPSIHSRPISAAMRAALLHPTEPAHVVVPGADAVEMFVTAEYVGTVEIEPGEGTPA